MNKTILAAALAASILGGAVRAAEPAKFALKKEVKLGGDGGWDYLLYDGDGKRLFIARATRVMVVDPASGKLLGEIPASGVHGVALAPDLGKGFTSNGKDGSVTVFDLKSLKTVGTVKLKGENPDAIVYEPATKTVWAFNGRSNGASAIDAVKGVETAVVPLDGKPEFAAVDGKGMVYVNIEDKSEVVAIDAAKAKIAHVWPLAGCEEPSGLAIDAENRRLFAGCHNKVMSVVDADSGKVVATLPIGAGVDATAFDPGAKLAFSSNGDGTLTVIREEAPDKFSVAQDAATQKGARTMALDASAHVVYLVTADMKEEPSADGKRPKRAVVPGTFRLLVMSRD